MSHLLLVSPSSETLKDIKMVKRSKARDTLLAVWCLCTGCWVRWCADYGCGVCLLPNGDSKSDAHETHGSTCWIKETKWMGPNVSFALNNDDKSTRKAVVMLVVPILTENSWIYLFASTMHLTGAESYTYNTQKEWPSCTKNRYDALSASFFLHLPVPWCNIFRVPRPSPHAACFFFSQLFFQHTQGQGVTLSWNEWAG